MEYTVGGVLVLLLLISPKGFSATELKISSNPVAVGENVKFEPILQMVVEAGIWLYEDQTILAVVSGTIAITKEYRDRVIFDKNTWTLSLKNVTLEDSGSYSFQGIVPSFTLKATLDVQEPVSNVTVRANATNLVEFNDTVSLTCSASGTSLSRRWVDVRSDITTGKRFHLSDDNVTLTIPGVLRTDSGPLYCIVSNGISNATSPPVFLNISYGPDHLQISENPSKTVYGAGSDITLSCLAQSKPNASYLWAFDGELLKAGGPELRLSNVQQKQSGNYTCWAHNSVTLRFSSMTTRISILELITNVSVMAVRVPIEKQNFTLTCEVTGPVDSIQWLRKGQPLVRDNRAVFSAGNGSVTFTPVLRSDDGSYECEAYNAVSNGTSPVYQLSVNYGPEQVVITGPKLAKTGSNVTFTCSASSQPAAQYTWVFRDKATEGSEYEKGPLTLADQGRYTCEAFNPTTGRVSNNSIELTVIAPITSVRVAVSGSPPIQDKPFTLQCEVNGQANSTQWLREGQPLSADNRTVFSADNSSVTFNPVLRSDDGSYQCEAYNAVSNGTSPKYQVLVNYGPEQPVIPGPVIAPAGVRRIFSCSASSRPPANYSWFFNGAQVASGSKYETVPLTLANQGMYTCEASNSVTGIKTTAVTELFVIALITSVRVNASGGLPIEDKPFTLQCEVNVQANFIQWQKAGRVLSADDRTVFSADRRSVTFKPVLRSDDGSYQCVAFNEVSNGTSPGYQVLVNYGPEQPVINRPDLAQTGQRVTLSCSALSRPLAQYSWYFKGARVANGSVYETAPLTLANQGTYTCVAFNPVTGRNRTKATELTVIAPITIVRVNARGALPIEGKSFTLECEFNGQATFIVWLRAARPLADNRAVFSADNSSVTFTPAMRSDDGSYKCEAYNAVSNGTSPDYPLLVNYGPEQSVINGPRSAPSGAKVTFSCSALSQPRAQYIWSFNGTRVANGSVYETGPLTLADQGTYTCEAFNTVTGNNSRAVRELIVKNAITLIRVNASGGLPVDDKPFTLECDVDGPTNLIQWLKDGRPLSADNRTEFSADNSSVTFNPVLRSDDGSYQCEAYDAVNNKTSPEYQLLVNYGPEQPVIAGPSKAETGTRVTFSCRASSQPLAQYSWSVNGTQVANGSVYETGPLTLADQGTYSCEAFNSVTGRNSTGATYLKVTESSAVLSKGSLLLTVLGVSLLQLFNWLSG